ncbi:hypothetical protein DL546_006567 [Coniochaeta pulveracea]|uniref:Uncharacterized protein n=1 Tax=Coniochaeta pulveracea TaxID=177199 RepID=A0A420YBM7_9PEZI|nr:hypothetical protein DL546_006567 [Coniochaeta pulveracea]
MKLQPGFASAGLLVLAVSAEQSFRLCKDTTCQDCPVGVASAATGHPGFVIYNSRDVTTDQGYPGSQGDGYKTYSKPQPKADTAATKKTLRAVKPSIERLQTRKGPCVENSWVPDVGKEDYTKPGDTRVLTNTVRRPVHLTIIQERSQSWTSTLNMSLGFEDVISLGMRLGVNASETITDSTSFTINLSEGQRGVMGFTPFWRCSTGGGTCNGKEVSGEVCVPYKYGDSLAGEYAFIVTS